MGKSLKGLGWNNVGPASETVDLHNFTIELMYRVIWVVAFRGIKCHLYGSQSKHNSVSMLGHRRIQLTDMEPAMGCDASATLNRYWVGRPTLCVQGTSYRRVH